MGWLDAYVYAVSADPKLTSSTAKGGADENLDYQEVSSCIPTTTGFKIGSALTAQDHQNQLTKHFGINLPDLKPNGYYRITDNWLELTVRFVVRTHRIRDAKDGMSRQIVEALQASGISIASATCDIVGFQPIEIKR